MGLKSKLCNECFDPIEKHSCDNCENIIEYCTCNYPVVFCHGKCNNERCIQNIFVITYNYAADHSNFPGRGQKNLNFLSAPRHVIVDEICVYCGSKRNELLPIFEKPDLDVEIIIYDENDEMLDPIYEPLI